ncbi:MAG: translation initiation factor IF-2, partial [Thermoplasmata archaeon]|nr:translation initiation factor IF-2 [Thermoplasmata archaeon]
DRIRGGAVVDREAGKITQHIGATEVPTEAIEKVCGKLLAGKGFSLPGLLFIDTPGHASFTSLRARGGSLADIALLVIDVMEGLKPQTIESINILKQYKTPFIIALNKIDRINGWKVEEDQPFILNVNEQDDLLLEELDKRIYSLIGDLASHGFNADRYDRVSDFTDTIAMVPMAARSGLGVPDALMLLMGLAQRFLEEKLETEEVPGEGTILEVKEEKGLGITMDTIIFSGNIRKGDLVVMGTKGEPREFRIKSLLKPKPMDEIRDPREKFDNVKEVHAAAGVKILAKGADDVLAGAPIRVVRDEVTLEEAILEVQRLTEVSIELDPEGIHVKADAIGSLEAMSKLLEQQDVKISKADVGDISERDIKDVASYEDPLKRILLAFNIKPLPDVERMAEEEDVKIIRNNVIYKIIEDHEEWSRAKKRELDDERRQEYAHPAKILVMRDHIFRISKPAVFGAKVLAGRVRSHQKVMREDGKIIGKISSIQLEKKTIKEAKMGDEVAMAIEGPMVGRHFNEDDVLYIEIPEGKVPYLVKKGELTMEERETLEHILGIKRREKPTWGMG